MRLRRRDEYVETTGVDVVDRDACDEWDAGIVVVIVVGMGAAKEARGARPQFTETAREEGL